MWLVVEGQLPGLQGVRRLVAVVTSRRLSLHHLPRTVLPRRSMTGLYGGQRRTCRGKVLLYTTYRGTMSYFEREKHSVITYLRGNRDARFI